MRIAYKRTALLDLQRTRDYITNTPKSKSAAQKPVTSVLHASDHPMMDTALNSRYDVDSDIRFLVVSKQLVFYQIVDDSLISVIRLSSTIWMGNKIMRPSCFKLERFHDAQALTVCSARKCWVLQRNS